MRRTGIRLVLLCLCCVMMVMMPRAFGQNTVNVARNQRCRQSSVYSSSNPCDNANNGYTGGTFNSYNCMHAGINDYNPWWEVDLGRIYPVHEINIWARSWPHIGRLYPFTITVDDQECVEQPYINKREITVTCSSILYGRVVRLTRGYKTHDPSLNMCEFEVSVPRGVSSCPAGWYGTQCDLACDSTCGGGPGNNFCDQTTGDCYGGCQPGYYGRRCSRDCLTTQCLNNQCDQHTGLCTACSGNFDGDYCTSCRDGYYGQNCDQHCSSTCASSSCQQDTGNCDACQPGYYGNTCSSDCLTTQCLNNQCDQQTGLCTACSGNLIGDYCSECRDGYYIRSNYCYRCDRNCKDRKCDQSNGKCNGCVEGRYGDRCTTACSPSVCSQCVQDTGRCTACRSGYNVQPPLCTDCLDGYYKLYSYSSSCTECTWKCYNNMTCDKASGDCERCPPGKRGRRCQLSCSGLRKYGQDCLEKCGQCQYRAVCDEVTGACDHCEPGWQFPLCQQECQNGSYGIDCAQKCGHCTDGAACDKATGQCPQCKPGWYLPLCDRECIDDYYGVNCTQQCGSCKGGVACNKTNGHCECVAGKQSPLCKTDCVGRTYGEGCEQTCGQCKGGQPCDIVTGECSSGCDPGWTDQNCQTRCPFGTYGDDCNKTCGNCQDNGVCHHVTGECQAGCAAGFTGSSCVQAQKQDEPSNTGTIAGAVVAVIAAVIIAVVVIVVIIRKRKQGTKAEGYTDVPAEMSSSRDRLDTPVYANTSTTSLSFAPAVAGKPEDKPKAQVKPTVKPPAMPKPVRSAKSNDAIYQNVSLEKQDSEPNLRPAVPANKLKADQGKVSPKLNGIQKATKTAKSQKEKPTSAVSQGRALKAEVETPPEPFTDDEDGEPAVYANEKTCNNLEPTSICLQYLRSVVQNKLKTGTLGEEFSRMIAKKDYPVKNGQREANYYKNRFNSILPYDKSRVELQQVDGDDSSDYINASFIKGHKAVKAYIAAQGPKVNTQDDFWRMVWQEGVTDVVMLTNLMEGAKTKCYEYWPAKGTSLNTGHMEVTALEEETRANFIIRTFDLKLLGGKEKRRVKQYHYLSWMDHEVPATTPLVNFWRYVRARAHRSAPAPPLVVHCSAGVGRTGTYIALDIAIDHAQKEPEISIYDIVDSLREDRCHMVQNKGQYEFLHEAVLEAYSSLDTRLQTSVFDSTFPLTISRDQPYTPIDKEFQTLTEMRQSLKQPMHTIANLEENRIKNRNPEALPDDRYVVFLTQHVKGRNQYINAIYMSTYFEARGSIVTQLPLPDTMMDLWRLVDGCDVNTIVSLGEVEGQKDMCRYWPKEGETIETGKYRISLESTDMIRDCLINYNLVMEKDGKTRAVRVLHYAGWTGEVADNTTDLIQLLTTLHSTQKERAGKPVIVQCIDGSARSGMFCALWDVFCRMASDGEVDVFLAVREVHNVIPQAVTSSKQYHFVYEVVQQSLNMNSQNVYANT